jgi:hypothetical protein
MFTRCASKRDAAQRGRESEQGNRRRRRALTRLVPVDCGMSPNLFRVPGDRSWSLGWSGDEPESAGAERGGKFLEREGIRAE